MDVEVIARLKIKNVVDQEWLDSSGISIENLTRALIEDDGLFGLVENSYDIIEVRKCD